MGYSEEDDEWRSTGKETLDKYVKRVQDTIVGPHSCGVINSYEEQDYHDVLDKAYLRHPAEDGQTPEEYYEDVKNLVDKRHTILEKTPRYARLPVSVWMQRDDALYFGSRFGLFFGGLTTFTATDDPVSKGVGVTMMAGAPIGMYDAAAQVNDFATDFDNQRQLYEEACDAMEREGTDLLPDDFDEKTMTFLGLKHVKFHLDDGVYVRER